MVRSRAPAHLIKGSAMPCEPSMSTLPANGVRSQTLEPANHRRHREPGLAGSKLRSLDETLVQQQADPVIDHRSTTNRIAKINNAGRSSTCDHG
jgi:hypothetical protein